MYDQGQRAEWEEGWEERGCQLSSVSLLAWPNHEALELVSSHLRRAVLESWSHKLSKAPPKSLDTALPPRARVLETQKVDPYLFFLMGIPADP